MDNSLTNFKTCILYFTRGKFGLKSFSSNTRKSNAVQRLLFSKTLSEIRKSQLDYRISNGAAFGDDILERLNGAIAHIFNSGFKKVIVVGDDTPELSVKQIQQAKENLSNGKLSIGPAKDGGTYLMAFSKSDFEKGILQKLSWHSPLFNGELLKNIQSAKLKVELLAPLEDLDTKLDLTVFLSRHFIDPFSRILKNLFFAVQKRFIPENLYFTNFSDYAFDRGPPQKI